MAIDAKPPRAVGLLGASIMPINGMVGAGIFAAPAVLYAAAGDFAPWMFALIAVLFFPIVWCFAQLSARFEGSGGPQLYAQAAFGPFIGFQAGWMRYVSTAASIAANTHVLVSYLAALFPAADGPIMRPLLVSGVIVIFGVLNYVGVKKAVATLGVISVGKFLPLLALIVIGLFAAPPEVQLALPDFGVIESVALITFYTFMGFEGLVMAAGEVKRPRKTIPSVLLISIGVTTLLYMLVQWAYIGVENGLGMGGGAGGVSGHGGGEDDMPLANMAGVLVGQWGAVVIAITAILSIAANSLASFITVPRLTYGMAEHGLLPRIFTHISPKYLTPDFSILFLAVAAILFGLTGAFVFLAVASTLSRITSYVLCALALPVLRKREIAKDNQQSWKIAMIAMPIIAIGTCLWVASQASMDAFITLGAALLAGTVLFYIAKRGSDEIKPSFQ